MSLLSIQKELIDFSNKRFPDENPNHLFVNYEDYIHHQTKLGFSLERNDPHWSNAQQICIEKKFKNIDRNIRILDICCGDGSGLQKFKEMGFINVVGVEISDEKIEFAKQHGYPILKRDICAGPFDLGEKYDIIYSSHSIEHVLNPEYTIQNIMEFLREDGTFFLILPYPDLGASNPYYDIHRYKVHCGVVPLFLHINDGGISTCNFIKTMGLSVIDVAFDNFREPEIHLTIVKTK